MRLRSRWRRFWNHTWICVASSEGVASTDSNGKGEICGAPVADLPVASGRGKGARPHGRPCARKYLPLRYFQVRCEPLAHVQGRVVLDLVHLLEQVKRRRRDDPAPTDGIIDGAQELRARRLHAHAAAGGHSVDRGLHRHFIAHHTDLVTDLEGRMENFVEILW
jgi:hypothetical protein